MVAGSSDARTTDLGQLGAAPRPALRQRARVAALAAVTAAVPLGVALVAQSGGQPDA